MTGKQVLKHLHRNGWQTLRTQGSSACNSPVHGNRDLGIGLLKAIEKQTGAKLR